MSSFFSKERLKALADQAKAGATQLQSQAQQGLQRMQQSQTQRRTSSREGTDVCLFPDSPGGLQAPQPQCPCSDELQNSSQLTPGLSCRRCRGTAAAAPRSAAA